MFLQCGQYGRSPSRSQNVTDSKHINFSNDLQNFKLEVRFSCRGWAKVKEKREMCIAAKAIENAIGSLLPPSSYIAHFRTLNFPNLPKVKIPSSGKYGKEIFCKSCLRQKAFRGVCIATRNGPPWWRRLSSKARILFTRPFHPNIQTFVWFFDFPNMICQKFWSPETELFSSKNTNIFIKLLGSIFLLMPGSFRHVSKYWQSLSIQIHVIVSFKHRQ